MSSGDSEKPGTGDPFDRIKREVGPKPVSIGKVARGGRPPATKGRQVTPVPESAPPPPAHGRLGKPSRSWAYRNADGRLLGYVLRFDPPTGKEIRPLTWRERSRGSAWTWEGFDTPRPLYGLDQLAARPFAPVLIVEGEKAADAARERFPDSVAVTWPGGDKGVGKADFGPLIGRTVTIWPDNDEPGREAARHVARVARRVGTASVAVVSLPPGLPEKWDLAEDWPPSFGPTEALAVMEVAGARAQGPARPPQDPDANGVTWPPGFRMDPTSGLWWEERGRDGTDKPQRLADPFEVLGQARGATGRAWSVVVRVKAPDGRSTVIVLPWASLQNGGGDARRDLADAGLRMAILQGLRDKLIMALMNVSGPAGRFIQLTETTGWHDGRFVLPGRTPIGPPGGEEVLFTGDATALKYGQRGEFLSWQNQVAKRALGNPLVMFALAAAFAPPLLRLLEAEGGGFHFRGGSASGKSTLLLGAGSAWGGDPNGSQLGFGHLWRSTANALESLATAHNDTLLCLDELGQVDSREAGIAAYALANGEAKKRLRADASLRHTARWALIVLSSGEVGLADHVASDGKGGRVAAGQELRLLEIPVDSGAGFGIWTRLDDGETGASRSKAFKAAAKAHYGHAGPLFLERLTADREALIGDTRDYMAEFRGRASLADDSGQIARSIDRFALIAAAGELAAGFGIVPWPTGAAIEAVLKIFEMWAADFGRNGLREDRQIIARVKGYIQRNPSAFGPLSGAGEAMPPDDGPRANEARSMTSAGYRWSREGAVFYLFNTAAFADVVKGFDAKAAKKTLHRAGYLETDGEQGRLTKKISTDGKKVGFICVRATILEEDT